MVPRSCVVTKVVVIGPLVAKVSVVVIAGVAVVKDVVVSVSTVK